jgi:D-alanyl-D-alanine carboxypeptidase (penicillin-binding protein 5/6)
MRRPWRRTALCALLVAPVLAVHPVVPSGAAVAAPTAPAVIHGITQLPSVGGPRLDEPGPVVDLPAGVPGPPPQEAVAWLLADAGSGDVLAAQAAHLPLRPASTQKMLTSLVLLPRLDPATVYTAIPDDANAEGSKVGVVPGATYTVDELFRGLFLASGNDAAHALAEVAGGQESTVAAMNALAENLQAQDTTAANPSGLDADTQWSSAYDLALIARAGLDMDSFRDYIATRRSQFPGAMPALPGEVRAKFEIANQNKLLTNYPGGIGVKTGYTSQARGTYVGAATRDGTTLVVTLMHTGSGAWSDAAALLDWGFAHGEFVQPVGELVDPLAPPPTTPPSVAVLGERAQAGAGSVAAGQGGSDSGASGSDDLVPGGVFGILVGALLLILASVVALRVRAVRRMRRRRRSRVVHRAVPRTVPRRSTP